MMPDLEAALEGVRRVFAARKVPVDVGYCTHCFTEAEIRRLIETAPERLTSAELDRVLWKAYTTWGDWPSLAYYVPRMLELYCAGELIDWEMLYYKLLVAARPEVSRDVAAGPAMTAAERLSIHRFFQALLEQRIDSAPDECAPLEEGAELFGMLAALAERVEEVVAPLRDGTPHRQGFWCVLAAQLVNSGFRWNRILPNIYLPKLRAAGDNEEALLAELEPERISLYILDRLEVVQTFGDDALAEVERAVGIS